MDAHKIVLRLLKLPVSVQPLPDEMGVREVLLGAYRLLKGLCLGFKVSQLALVTEIDKIVAHIEYKLISYDITPTGCLASILKDNLTACMQITDELIRRFVRLAAETHAPRFLRFLRTLSTPNGTGTN